MSRKTTVHPAEGRLIRDPATGEAIPASGATVQWSPFWQRRLDDGDLRLTATPSPRAEPQKPAKKES